MNSKIFKLIKVSSVISMCALTMSSSVFASSIGVAKKTINLRKLPVDVGKIVGFVYAGEKLAITDQKLGWYLVTKDNKQIGWVSGSYLDIKSSASATKKTTIAATVKQTASSKSVAGKAIASKTPAKSVAKTNAQKPVAVVATQKIAVNTKTQSLSFSTPKSANISSKTGVNIRKSPDIKSNALNLIAPGTGISVIGKENDWYKVKVDNNTIGYVMSSFVSFANISGSRGSYAVPNPENNSSKAQTAAPVAKTPAAVQKTPAPAVKAAAPVQKAPEENNNAKVQAAAPTPAPTSSSNVDSLIDLSKKYIGTPYVWGGTTPDGFDCSGFMYYLFHKYGVSLNRVASDQATQGQYVSRQNLEPGDLIFFDTSGYNNGNINHVGLYIGGGNFIHASSGRHQVTISSIFDAFYSSAYVEAKRVM